MKLEGWLARFQSAKLTRQVMLRVERYFESAYADAAAESEGLRHQVLLGLAAHAAQRAAVLAARGEHACMRCQFDRSGILGAIARDHPRIYVCGACHDEVLAEVPADLRASFELAPPDRRRAMIVERALGAPSKRIARDEVHTALANQPALRSPAPAPYVARQRIGPSGPSNAPVTTLELAPADSEPEEAYTRQLFGVVEVRARW